MSITSRPVFVIRSVARAATLLLAAFALASTSLVAEPSALDALAAPADRWPSFRGANASGVADAALPTVVDRAKGVNVRFDIATPGLGLGAPVVWGDKLFLTTAVSTTEDADGPQALKVGLYGGIMPAPDYKQTYRWQVLCFDAKTGALRWTQTAHEGVPAVKRHTKASYANSTPAVDDQRLVVFFGSQGLYAYDHDGKKLWSRNFGVLDSGFFAVPKAQWGFASSPVLHDDKVIIQVDVQGDSFLAMLDAATGETIWRTPREEVPTWSTPTVITHGDAPQIVVNGWQEIAGYTLADGKRLWTLPGGGDVPVPTPVAAPAAGVTFLTNAHGPGKPLYAVRPDGTLAWELKRKGAYMPTPVHDGERLYVLRNNGVFSAFRVTDGEEVYTERVASDAFMASPVLAGGRVYIFGEYGDIYIVTAGDDYALETTIALDEVVLASPAVAHGTLYVRTQGHLVALAEGFGPEAPAASDTTTEAADAASAGR
ncbi:MAG: PQQ-binding-like beta-propeller repeat protein [Acidobacteriota bacterium]